MSGVARLHSLFDAAVRHGASSLLCHYVDEVCGRDDFSPDGVEAYLRDGEWWQSGPWRDARRGGSSGKRLRVHRLERPKRCGRRGTRPLFEATQDVLGRSARAAAGEPEPLSSTEAPAARAGRTAPGRAASMRRKLQMSFDDASRGCAPRRWRGSCARARRRRRRTGTADPRRGPARSARARRRRRRRRGRARASDGGAGKSVGPRGVPALDDGALFLDDLEGAGAVPVPVQERRGGARTCAAPARRADALIAGGVCFVLPSGRRRPRRRARVLRAEPAFAAAPVRADRRRRSAGRLGLREATRRGARSGAKMARADLPAKFVAARRARRAGGGAGGGARRGNTSRAELDETLEADASSAKSAASAFARSLAVTVRLVRARHGGVPGGGGGGGCGGAGETRRARRCARRAWRRTRREGTAARPGAAFRGRARARAMRVAPRELRALPARPRLRRAVLPAPRARRRRGGGGGRRGGLFPRRRAGI